MKYIVTILLLFVSIGIFAQHPDLESLNKAIRELDSALIKMDTVALKSMLSDSLNIGYPGGTIEKKKDILGGFRRRMVFYMNIISTKPKITICGNVASVRRVADVELLVDGNGSRNTWNELSVWIWNSGHWELFTRQNVKK